MPTSIPYAAAMSGRNSTFICNQQEDNYSLVGVVIFSFCQM